MPPPGQEPPLPKDGCVPVVHMVLHWGPHQALARALMDSGATIPLMSLAWAKPLTIPIAGRKHIKKVEDFAGADVPGAGKYYSYPLMLQCGRHFTVESFEVAPMAPDYDIILPNWWMAEHSPVYHHQPGQAHHTSRTPHYTAAFTAKACQDHCTKEACLKELEGMKPDEETIQKTLSSVSAAPTERELQEAIARVPEAFREFIPIMTSEAAMVLPEHTTYDHTIELKEGSVPPWGPIYPLNELELEELRNWLKKMTDMGAVRPSKSSCSSPVLFVPKGHGGGLRLCVDYRGLNKVTVPNRYPLPNMDELRERVRGSRWFTRLDLKNGYHLVRIKPGDEWKTAFRCRYGLYEYTVMPFGLMNAPATFQSMMNHIFRDMLDVGTIAFMDDILIHAETKKEHDCIALEVLRRLRDNRLCIAPDKCEWAVQKVEFLGYVISGDGLEMTNDKVEAIQRIPPVNSLKDVQGFIGFANFYKRFIRNFSEICLPLTDSTALRPKDWRQTPQIVAAQRALIEAFTTAPVLRHFDPALQPIVETDASDYALGAILSQKHDKFLHPVAFHSRKFTSAEVNYDVCDKELLAIVDSFKKWRRYLEGARLQVHVISDHNNLELFATTKILNRRQARWAQELAGYDFRIFFRPGKQNAKADFLSRRPEHRLEKGEDGMQGPILLPRNLRPPERIEDEEEDKSMPTAVAVLAKGQGTLPEVSSAGEHLRFILSGSRLCSIPTRKWSGQFLEDVREAAAKDDQYQRGLVALQNATEEENKDAIMELEEGLLHYKKRLYVPQALRERILNSEHDSKVAGHFGQDKTLELVRRNFWWPGMKAEVIRYVQSCRPCQEDKARRHRQYGLLSPLELPYAPWTSISMDFITGLPVSDEADEIWVVVDRFTKMAHFLPLKTGKKTAADLARTFAKEVWRIHGLPADIISDRDSRFTSSTWQTFIAVLGIKPRMSTAFHPQTDGQTERMNQVLEAYLRSFIAQDQDDWADLLPMAEFAYNNSAATATGMTPFFANMGYHPAANDPRTTEAMHPASEVYSHWIQDAITRARSALEEARVRMVKYADRTRKEAPAYEVGDAVMLSTKNLKIKRPSRKLDHKYIGPFRVEKVVSPSAVQLTLPQRWRVHPVFHVSLLEPFVAGSRPSPDFERILREVSDLEEEEEYDIEEIMASITRRKRVLYLVKWLGFPRKKDWTYEPYENFSEGAYDKLRAFHEKNPSAPRDYRLQDPAPSLGGPERQGPASLPERQDSGQGPALPPEGQEQGTGQRMSSRKKGKEPAPRPERMGRGSACGLDF